MSQTRVTVAAIERTSSELAVLGSCMEPSRQTVCARARMAIEELERRASEARQAIESAEDAIANADEDEDVEWAYDVIERESVNESRAEAARNKLASSLESIESEMSFHIRQAESSVALGRSTLASIAESLVRYANFQATGLSDAGWGSVVSAAPSGRSTSFSDETRLAQSLRPFVVTKREWAVMPIEKRMERLREVAQAASHAMKIRPLDIEFFEGPCALQGGFRPYLLQINLDAMAYGAPAMMDPMECFDTVIHETRHAFQYSVAFDLGAEHPQKETWKANFLDYIDPNVDPEGYREQPIEDDAFTFSSNVIRELFELGGKINGR